MCSASLRTWIVVLMKHSAALLSRPPCEGLNNAVVF